MVHAAFVAATTTLVTTRFEVHSLFSIKIKSDSMLLVFVIVVAATTTAPAAALSIVFVIILPIDDDR